MILATVMIAVSAGLIVLSGMHFASAMNELANRLPSQYRDNPRSVATAYIWDRSMPDAGRRHYIAFIGYGAAALILAAVVTALLQLWTLAVLFAAMALAVAGDGFYRASKFRREAVSAGPER